jgi:TonB family protein
LTLIILFIFTFLNQVCSQTDNDTLIGVSPFYKFEKEFICYNFSGQLMKNIEYPKEAIENNITGTLWVKFTVTKDGKIENVVIVRELWPSCDKSVVNGVEKLNSFIPPFLAGDYVDANLTVNVTFKKENGNFSVHVDNYFDCEKEEYKKQLKVYKKNKK